MIDTIDFPTYTFHPVCGRSIREGEEHTAHRVYVGGQPGEKTFGMVGMRESMRYAIDTAEPTCATDFPTAMQIVADREEAERMMALTPDVDGYALVDDEAFAAMKRLVDDARDYADTCGYAEDDTCEPVERAAAGFGLVCWPVPR